MKRLISALISTILILTLFSGCSGDITKESKHIIKIGVFEPATGNSASGGKKEMLGIKYAHSLTPSVEIMGERYDIELVYSDNGSNQNTAIDAAKMLVEEDISLAIGSYGSDVSIAASDTFMNAGIPVIGASCTSIYVTMGNNNYFRICYEDPIQATTLSTFAHDKFAAKKAFLLGEANNEYDQGLMIYFEQDFIAKGGQVLKESFPEGTSVFTEYLNKAIEYEADVIFIPVSIAYATQIILQAHNMNIDIPILGSDTLDDNKILNASNNTNLELYVSSHYHEGANETFDNNFKQYINSNPELLSLNGGNDTISAVSVLGYDAYNVAIDAIIKANTNESQDILRALSTITHKGVSGDIVFDNIDGDANRTTAYIIKADVQNNTWIPEKIQNINNE